MAISCSGVTDRLRMVSHYGLDLDDRASLQHLIKRQDRNPLIGDPIADFRVVIPYADQFVVGMIPQQGQLGRNVRVGSVQKTDSQLLRIGKGVGRSPRKRGQRPAARHARRRVQELTPMHERSLPCPGMDN